MKKLFFSALAICGFIAVNAQSTDGSDATINVEVVKTIQVLPAEGVRTFDFTYDKPGEFGAMKSVTKQWTINSTDDFGYKVTFNRGTIPAAVTLGYTVSDSEGSLVAVNGDEHSASNVAAGANRKLTVKVDATVPWGVNAGSYKGDLVITATAN